jgi:hypothetical protein
MAPSGYDPEGGGFAGQSEGYYINGYELPQAARDAGFDSKYTFSNGVRDLGDGRLAVSMQQPGAHKYDTWDAIYQRGEDGRYTLTNTPEGYETRETSGWVQGRDQARDITEKAAIMAAAAAAMYGGGMALGGALGGTAGIGTVGAETMFGVEGAGGLGNLAAGGSFGNLGALGGAAANAGDAGWEAAAEAAKGSGYGSAEQIANEAAAISEMDGGAAAWEAATEAAKEGLPEYGGPQQIANEASAIKELGGSTLTDKLLDKGKDLLTDAAKDALTPGGGTPSGSGTKTGGGFAMPKMEALHMDDPFAQQAAMSKALRSKQSSGGSWFDPNYSA